MRQVLLQHHQHAQPRSALVCSRPPRKARDELDSSLVSSTFGRTKLTVLRCEEISLTPRRVHAVAVLISTPNAAAMPAKLRSAQGHCSVHRMCPSSASTFSGAIGWPSSRWASSPRRSSVTRLSVRTLLAAQRRQGRALRGVAVR
jgi:hypothetical protein